MYEKYVFVEGTYRKILVESIWRTVAHTILMFQKFYISFSKILNIQLYFTLLERIVKNCFVKLHVI